MFFDYNLRIQYGCCVGTFNTTTYSSGHLLFKKITNPSIDLIYKFLYLPSIEPNFVKLVIIF